MPLLAALDELLPWLKQWHNELDPNFGERMSDYFDGFLQDELRTLVISRQQLNDWRPLAKTRGGRKTKTAKA